MIAVVTGSSGFIGSHLVDALLLRGATVRALVRPDSPDSARDARVACWTADLLDDRSVRESPIWKGVTHVFHVGGVTKRRTLAQFRDGNVVPTANILAAIAARAPRISRFVLLSSQAAAGPARAPDRPVTEDDEPRPIEAYGQSKREGEDATRRYATSLPMTVLRPGAVYGPRDVDFLNVFRQATNRVAFYAAPRDQLMSLVYVRDLIDAMLLAADAPQAAGRTYFVASEKPATWSEIYHEVAALAGTAPREIQLPAPLLTVAGQVGSLVSRITGRHGLVNANKMTLSRPRWWLCDSSRIRGDLGWDDPTSLREGVRETYNWYVGTGWLHPKSGDARQSGDKAEERV